jgi:hypothetical protein
VAFPSTGVLDTFTRANGALGANWSTYTADGANAAAISSNTVVATSGYSGMLWTASFGPDCEAYCDLVTLPTGWFVALNLRTNAVADTGYICIASAGSIDIENNGVAVLNTGSVAWAAGDKVGLRVSGGTLSVFRYTAGAWNQTPVLTASDPNLTASGLIGFGIGDGGTNTVAIDNFGGGTLPVLFAKTVTATTTFTAALPRQARKTMVGTTTFTAAAVRRTQLVKAASVTFTAVISKRSVTKTLAATTAFTGTVTRQARYTVAATTTFTATAAARSVKTVTVAATTTFTASVQTVTFAAQAARQFVTGRRTGTTQPDDLKNVGGRPRN